MNNSSRSYQTDELLGEIMGFLPKNLLDEYYNNMNVMFGKMMEGILERLKELEPDKQQELDQELNYFAKSCEVELDDAFNTFQQYLFDNIWKIPRNMNVMPAHYKGLEQNFAEESEDIIENELNLMQQQILAQKAYQRLLLNGITKKEKELEKLERYEEFISHVICIPEQETYTIPLSLIQTMKRNLDELKQSTMASIMTSRDVARNIRDMDTRSQYLRESLKRQLDVFLIPQAKRSKQDGS